MSIEFLYADSVRGAAEPAPLIEPAAAGPEAVRTAVGAQRIGSMRSKMNRIIEESNFT